MSSSSATPDISASGATNCLSSERQADLAEMPEDRFGKRVGSRCDRMRLGAGSGPEGVRGGGSAGSCTGRSFLGDFDEQEVSTRADAAAAQVAISSEGELFAPGLFG